MDPSKLWGFTSSGPSLCHTASGLSLGVCKLARTLVSLGQLGDVIACLCHGISPSHSN